MGHLTNSDVVNVYNIFAKQSSISPVKKFRDKETGHRRLQDITRGKDRRVIVAALKECKVKPEIIKLLPDEPVTIAVPVEASTAKVPAKIEADKVLSVAAAKEDARHVKESKKESAAIRKELKLTDHAVEVFRAILSTCTDKSKEVTTTELATALKTGWPTVSRAVESLKKSGLIRVEDDSADDNNPLWYIKVTKLGYEFRLPASGGASTGTATAKPKKALPADRPGPRSGKVGKKIYKLVDGNPRREGTHGHKSFALIKNGMTYEDYIKAGGRNNDLAWDVDHNYVEIK